MSGTASRLTSNLMVKDRLGVQKHCHTLGFCASVSIVTPATFRRFRLRGLSKNTSSNVAQTQGVSQNHPPSLPKAGVRQVPVGRSRFPRNLCTPLHVASELGHFDLLCLLLEGADARCLSVSFCWGLDRATHQKPGVLLWVLVCSLLVLTQWSSKLLSRGYTSLFGPGSIEPPVSFWPNGTYDEPCLLL